MSAWENTGKTRVLALLDDLGPTVDDVAATLEQRGIRGVPGRPRCCPIALYLQACGVETTFVSALSIEAAGIGLVELRMDAAVGDFIADFDDHPETYSALVDSGRWASERAKLAAEGES